MVDAEIIKEWISKADEDFKFAHQKIPLPRPLAYKLFFA